MKNHEKLVAKLVVYISQHCTITYVTYVTYCPILSEIVLRALLLIPRAAQICHLVPLIASGTSQAQIETSKLSFGVRFRHVLQRYKRCFGLFHVT